MVTWNDDDWKAYAGAVRTSAERCRWAMFLIAAVSIAMLACVWFNRPHNWTQERIEFLRGKVAALQGTDPEGAQARLDFLEKVSIERAYLVNIPFLGLVVEVNDLEAAGGLTLFLLLTVFYYARARELANIRHAVWLVQHSPRKVTHAKELAMGQVLCVTPDTSRLEEDPAVPSTWLPFLPAVVLGTAMIFDLVTVAKGWAVSHLNTITTFALGLFFLASCLLLGCMCRRLGVAMAEQWRLIEKELLEGFGGPKS